ncbi:MAG: cation-translocating P-type ATPase [Clostridiales bacterium]|nr:cation-translocating P-type ATPase [Clostridiales bacterium]
MENTQERETERIEAAPDQGLSRSQVAQRIAAGLDHKKIDVQTKSYGRIFRDNLCTLFNLLNVALAAAVLLVGSYRNALFILIILCNIAIGTFQEIRAKRTVDRLSLLSEPKAHVVREGKEETISIQETVLDDILVLHAGNQVCADSIVVLGECEADESLLTGEADPVTKRPGDTLLSGSFITVGSCRARVDKVGQESYAARITADAKKIRKPNSRIMKSLNSIIKTVSALILPVGILLFCKEFFILQVPVARAVTGTVAALIGMIPEGLILLTSVVLAVGVIRLSRHKTLVQELYCIETLARVDVLCLDKTGTITKGSMRVTEILRVDAAFDAHEMLADLAGALDDQNPTFAAIREYVKEPAGHQASHIVPFSSARKWSGASFPGEGSYLLGAAEFVCPEALPALQEEISRQAAEGKRVLVLARSSQMIEGEELPGEMRAAALVLLEDEIREEAPETLAFFAREGVDIKIISGDHPQTVAAIAKRAGLQGADHWADVSQLSDAELEEAAGKYTVFGRVLPEQKRTLVRAFQKQGHTVAMTGDGVNDVLALKDADCSIAVATGSDAARNASQLVLLDSNFSSLYHVVMEGRRAINNIQRSASLFLVKTIFSAVLSILFLFLPYSYPFAPIQLSLISTLTVGIPSFLLALEPNRERVQGDFLMNILRRAIPGAFSIILNVLIITLMSGVLDLSAAEISTVTVLSTGAVGLMVLCRICQPFNWIRGTMVAVLAAAFVGAAFLFREVFYLTPLNLEMACLIGALVLVSFFLMWGFSRLADRLCDKERGIVSRFVGRTMQDGENGMEK